MQQEYSNYTPEDSEVWKLLFDRQVDNLKNKASKVYLDCLELMSSALNPNKVPDFKDLNIVLKKHQGWQLEVVPGLIPVEDFFQLLAQKKFCSSTWLRKKDQLDYLEEPDMFHDIFGHTPLLLNEDFSRFAERIGKIGCNHLDNEEILLQLQRIYWFTIEFGVIKENNEVKLYGAGIMSSFGEANHVYEDAINLIPYNIEEVIQKTFITTEIQNDYVMIKSYKELFDSLDILENKYKK